MQSADKNCMTYVHNSMDDIWSLSKLHCTHAVDDDSICPVSSTTACVGCRGFGVFLPFLCSPPLSNLWHLSLQSAFPSFFFLLLQPPVFFPISSLIFSTPFSSPSHPHRLHCSWCMLFSEAPQITSKQVSLSKEDSNRSSPKYRDKREDIQACSPAQCLLQSYRATSGVWCVCVCVCMCVQVCVHVETECSILCPLKVL